MRETERAERVAVGGDVTFWRHGDDIFRTSGSFIDWDLYGRPLGARWECDARHWARYRSVYAWAVDVAECGACGSSYVIERSADDAGQVCGACAAECLTDPRPSTLDPDADWQDGGL